jgi:cytochrome c oxidase assembly protein subunit 15
MIAPALHRFILLLAAATLVLLGMGGLVTSHGVGMAVPDWPNSYGYNMFFFPVSQWVGGVWYEHTHRLAGSVVGMLTVVLAIWLHGQSARRFVRWTGLVLLVGAVATLVVFPRRLSDGFVLGFAGLVGVSASFRWPSSEPAPKWLRTTGLVALGAVVVQGILGGLRVTAKMDELGIFHAALAQLFFVLVCAMSLFTSKAWTAMSGASELRLRNSRLTILFSAATLLVLAQLVLGASMRHQHAGLAIPDFPLAYGKLWPATDASSIIAYNQKRLEISAYNSITAGQIYLQMAHRFTAIAILGVVFAAAWLARKSPIPLRRGTQLWLGLVLSQVILGAATVLSDKAADIATAHMLIGALTLALGGLLTIISFRLSESFNRRAEAATQARLEPSGLAPQPAQGT